MADYQLPSDNAVHGSQLVQEVQDAHGIDISLAYSFIPPRTVTVSSAFDAYDLSAVVAAHSPAPAARTLLSNREFAGRFTDAERKAIRTSADDNVQKLREEMMLAAHADLSHPDLINGINYLEATGVIAAGRADEILDPFV